MAVADIVLEAYWLSSRESDPSLQELEERVALARRIAGGVASVELRHLKSTLGIKFQETLSNDDALPLISRRLDSARMLANDSMDATALDAHAARSDAYTPAADSTIKLAVERVASRVLRTYEFLDRAKRVTRARLARAPPDKSRAQVDRLLEEWGYEAHGEITTWGFALFDEMYNNGANAGEVEPITAAIWKTSRKVLGSGARRNTQHARIDLTHAEHSRGSANLAFLYNLYPEKTDFTPWGNWRETLINLYKVKFGIHGRRCDIPFAIHYSALEPSNPNSIREISMLCGKRNLGKSIMFQRFEYLFNRCFDPETERKWFQFVGGGTKCAMQSGGIAFTSGGVAWVDEAVEYVAGYDPAHKEQLQLEKQLSSDHRTSRPRPERVALPDGTSQWVTRNWEMYGNTKKWYAHNLGCNCQYLAPGTGLPICPDPDRNAYLSRAQAYVVTESERGQTMDKAAFERSLEEHRDLCDQHSVVCGLTYIVKHFCAMVWRCRPSNESAANAAFEMVDDFLNSEYDIPKPDDRRKTIRRDLAFTMAVEQSVVEVFLYKPTAVSYASMLPVSRPFESGRTGVHTLKPFSWSHLLEVVRALHYSMEVVICAVAESLPRNMYTSSDVHESLVEFAKRHGSGHALQGQSIATTDASARAPSQHALAAAPAPGSSSLS